MATQVASNRMDFDVDLMDDTPRTIQAYCFAGLGVELPGADIPRSLGSLAVWKNHYAASKGPQA